jgi:hypothetical protein
MKKRMFVLLILLVMILSLTIPSSASNAIQVSGTRQMASPPQNRVWWPVGDDKCFVKVDFTYQYAGDLAGTAINHFQILSHGPCEESGPVPYKYHENLLAWGTFTGDVAGASGSFHFVEVGEVQPVAPGEVAYTGRVLIRSGTDELEDLRGWLNLSWIKGAPSTDVSGWIHLGDDD